MRAETSRKEETSCARGLRSSDAASVLKISEQDLYDRLEKIRAKLFLAREKRVHPLKDDKILTDWNGLMIAALAKAAQALHEAEYANVRKEGG